MERQPLTFPSLVMPQVVIPAEQPRHGLFGYFCWALNWFCLPFMATDFTAFARRASGIL